MKIIIDISDEKYKDIQAMDWKNPIWADEVTRAIHEGTVLPEHCGDLPSVNPKSKTGHWIADVDRWGEIVTTVNGYRCSECNIFNTDKDNYCPNCGAKMVESDCRDCKEYKDCLCGKDGHESGTSQGYSIGECKDFEPQEGINADSN